MITKLKEQFKNFKSSYRGKQNKRVKKILGKSDWFSGVRHHVFIISTKSSCFVRSGIRTHAYKSRLRPERSALDRSAILTRTGLQVKFLVRKESYLAEQLESYLAELWTFLSPESLVIILITKLNGQFKNFKSSYQGKQQTTEENWA